MEKTLKVGLITQSPHIEKCVVKPPYKCPQPGTSMELFSFLASLLGYTKLEIVVAKEQRQIVNETLGGLVGMVARGEVDASPTLFSMSQDPIEMFNVDYSLPIATLTTGFIIKEPQWKHQTYTNIFEPFSPRLWFWVILTTLVVRILLFVISFAGEKIGQRQLTSQRILGVTKASGLMFIILRAYKSQLIGALVAQQKAPLPFTSLESYANLFEKGEIHMAAKPPGTFLDIERLDVKPYVKIRSAWSHNPVRIFPNDNTLLDAIATDPRLSHRIAETSYLHKTGEICNVTFVPVTSSWLAYIFPKGSKLKDEFSSLLYSKGHSIEDVNIRLLSRYTKPRRCGPSKASLKSYTRLRLKDEMAGSFVLLLVGSCLAAIMCIVELISFKF